MTFRFPILLTGLFGFVALAFQGCKKSVPAPNTADSPATASTKAPAFVDIGRVLSRHCVQCHHTGGPAPFPLETEADATKHARLIAEVTRDRTMPPWLPAPIPGLAYAHENRLSTAAIQLLGDWHQSIADGTHQPSNTPDKLTPPPSAIPKADLVIRAPEPITLPAEAAPNQSADTFVNLVLPLPADFTEWQTVRAATIVPGNPRAVHHAILKVDTTGTSRAADAATSAPGFPGMDVPGAHNPPGFFVGWTPGKTPDPGSPETGWRLGPGTDLVLQLHLFPTGKSETFQPEVHLTFLDQPRAYEQHSILLFNADLDIPAGVSAHTVTDRYTATADLDLLGLYPHAHYLATDIRLTATRPDGTTQPLLHIPDWDFNWQDDYRFASPLGLPKGTHIDLAVTFDNSAENPRNPHDPPRRVTYGSSTTDEMASALLTVRVADDTPGVRFTMDLDRRLATRGPNPGAWNRLGENHLRLNEREAAIHAFESAIDIDPGYATARYHLGLLSPPAEAITHHQAALASHPNYAPCHAALAGLLANQAKTEDDLETAGDHFRAALAIRPDLPVVNFNYANLLCRQSRFDDALPFFARELARDPNYHPAHLNRLKALARVRAFHELHRRALVAFQMAEQRGDLATATEITALLRANPRPAVERVTAKLITPPPVITMREAAPYKHALATAEYERADGTRLAVAHWRLRDTQPLPFSTKPGDTVNLLLSPFHLNPGLENRRLFNPIDDPELRLYFAVPE